MMRFSLFFLVLFLAACSADKSLRLSQIQQDVAILASDSLAGRETGTSGEEMAAAYIASRFAAIGLTAAGTEGYFQEFFVKESANPHEQPLMNGDSLAGTRGKNVVALLDNPGEDIMVIGAHYDHLGAGGFSSLHRGEEAIHNGADDNASGVAALLALAGTFAQKPIQNDLLFIAFSGEEKGLWGSNYFVKNPTVDMQKVKYMINMDMVGRLDTAKGLVIHGTGTAAEWPDLLNKANEDGLKVIMKESGVGPSDHTSFYLQDLPVLHYFTGQHADYHKPTDDAYLLSYEGIGLITDHIARLVRLTDQTALSFQKTKDESTQGPRFTVTLGVIPDYLFDGKGMRIDGVSEGKPAQQAGLLKGDVVTQLGDSTVTDMMSYMRALSAFEKGDSTRVVVTRDSTVLTFPIVF